MHTTLFLFYAGLARLGHAAYSVQDNYNAGNWVNMFNFDTFDDPTHGYVNYVDLATAQYSGLFKTDNNVVTFGSDSTSVASGRGRNSVRLTSKNAYTHGLVVVDIAHMPGNACGIWPAFWMTGPNWPNNGEIDIIEGVNTQSGNQATLHTNAGCSIDGTTCLGNLGCSKPAGGSNAYGDGFNANQGGVYAVEWTTDRISLWFFGRGSVPEDALGDVPDPSGWGSPTTTFAGGNGCDIDSHFRNNQIVFDTTFCGDWAGSVFTQDSTCAATGSSCEDYVKNHPEAFSEAYWTVNALKVYSDDGSSSPVLSSTDSIPASTPALSVLSPETVTSAITPTSLPTLSSSNPLGSISSSTPLAEETTIPTAPEQAGTELPSSFSSPTTAPTTATSYVAEGVVIETASTAVTYYTAPPAGYEDYPHSSRHGPLEGSKRAPKMKRAHRAARHLKNHISGIYG